MEYVIMPHEINVAKDFSPYPFGRYRSDGDSSGQHFRESVLAPALDNYSHIIIDFGTIMPSSAFLEEAFGGLVRLHGYSFDQLSTIFKIKSEDQCLVTEIEEYIKGEY